MQVLADAMQSEYETIVISGLFVAGGLSGFGHGAAQQILRHDPMMSFAALKSRANKCSRGSGAYALKAKPQVLWLEGANPCLEHE